MLEIKNIEMKYLNAKNRKIEGNVCARLSNIFGNCNISRFLVAIPIKWRINPP